LSFSNNVIIFFTTHNNTISTISFINTPKKPDKEANSKKRKYEMCCFGDSYFIRSKKEYERNLLFPIIESQQQ
jgi:hypothetical protein